jgi:hypothetical protein
MWLGATLIGFGGYFLWYQFTKLRCQTEVTKEVNVVGSAWVIRSRNMLCGYGVGSGIDIVAFNKKTSQQEELVKGSDIYRATFSSDSPGEATMVIPSLSDIAVQRATAPGLNIVHKLVPRGNMEDHEHYVRWSNDKLNDTNRRWYCENVLSKITEPNKSRLDSALGYVVSLPHGARNSYCHEG